MVCTSPRDRSNSNGSASDCRYSNSNGLSRDGSFTVSVHGVYITAGQV